MLARSACLLGVVTLGALGCNDPRGALPIDPSGLAPLDLATVDRPWTRCEQLQNEADQIIADNQDCTVVDPATQQSGCAVVYVDPNRLERPWGCLAITNLLGPDPLLALMPEWEKLNCGTKFCPSTPKPKYRCDKPSRTCVPQ